MLSMIWDDVTREWRDAAADCTYDIVPVAVGDSGQLAATEAEAGGAKADIVAFARDTLGFTVEPSQIAFLTSAAKRGIVN